jgi:mono/diheme cytochrome c family protein
VTPERYGRENDCHTDPRATTEYTSGIRLRSRKRGDPIMRRMRILAVIAGAIAALILGTAYAGDASNVVIVKGNAVYVPPTDGATMYQEYCAPCHGVDGRGYGRARPALSQHPVDLTRLSAMNGGTFPSHHVRYVLLDAGPKSVHASDMPAWAVVLQAMNRDNPGTAQLRARNLAEVVESMQEHPVLAQK